MNCRNVVANLSSFIDHELSPEIAEPVYVHLEKCASCRQEEEDLRSLKRLLANSEHPELDPQFESRLQEWIKDPSTHGRRPLSRRAISLWLLAPASIVTVWLLFATVTPTAASSTPVATAAHSEVNGNVARDQIYDLAQSQPLYGAPVVTAVNYVR